MLICLLVGHHLLIDREVLIQPSLTRSLPFHLGLFAQSHLVFHLTPQHSTNRPRLAREKHLRAASPVHATPFFTRHSLNTA